MQNIDELLEKVEELDINDFNIFKKKFHENIKLYQQQKFNHKFPNLQLDDYSMVKAIENTIFYYKFSSQVYLYEFEIVISNAKAKKYILKFFVDGEQEQISKKIAEKKIIEDNKLNIKKHFYSIGEEIVQVDITLDELHSIINYLFFNKKFIYNV
jgi:hypothetical protein